MGLREKVSLLMTHGHAQARHYPVPMLWTEVRFVVRRENKRHATEAILTQMAINSALSAKGGKRFKEQITKMTKD